MQIVGQLPMIAGWQDAPLVLKDLAEAICIIKLHAPPISCKRKFHDNKSVSNSPPQGNEHGSPE